MALLDIQGTLVTLDLMAHQDILVTVERMVS